MKRIINKYILLACFASSFVACNDFLTEDLKTDYNSSTFYTSETNAIRAINGVYNSIKFTSANNLIWVFGDVASDDAEKGGNPGDLVDADLIHQFNVTSDNGVLAVYWQFCYEGINRANSVIVYTPQISMDDNMKQRIVGEAKFLRAYNYFYLVNIWGQVPLRLDPPGATNLNVPLSDVATIYAKIESDLMDALNSPIPAQYTNPSDAGRVTKGAVYGLLAKTYLYQGKWNDCLTAINNLEALQLYSLESNYGDLFKSGAENSKEAIFAILHMSGQNPGMGNILNVYFAPYEEGGYYMNCPTQSYVDAFDEKTISGGDDPRLDASIGRDGHPWVNGNIFSSEWSPTGYLIKKQNQPLSEVPIGTKADGSYPYIYLRYADILLMKAEAFNERNQAGDFNNATTAIDLVRGRVNLAPVAATNQLLLRTAIQKERRREFGFEFHRFFDLMRWGKDVAVAALDPNFKWQEPRYYFPIPLIEKDTNKAIQ